MFVTNALLIERKNPLQAICHTAVLYKTLVGAVYSVAPSLCETTDLGCGHKAVCLLYGVFEFFS